MEELYREIAREIERQDGTHPQGYPNTRDGVRLGLATLQDELNETLAEWHSEKKIGWRKLPEELLQTIAVGIRLYRSIKAEGDGRRE